MWADCVYINIIFQVFIIDTRTIDDSISSASPILKWEITDSKVTSMIWGTLDETIITGHEAGDLIQWDLRVCMIKLNT